MARGSRVRRQRPVAGGRHQLSAGFIRELERAIDREQHRFGVSRAFVIATAVGFALGVEEQEDYHQAPRTRRRAA